MKIRKFLKSDILWSKRGLRSARLSLGFPVAGASGGGSSVGGCAGGIRVTSVVFFVSFAF